IAALIPDGFFERYFASDFLSMILMLVAGIPMYVCASASTPIAASLIMKGISPGAALVFLLTGPATNAITISTVLETLGRKTAFIYISSIALISLLLGYLLNLIAGWQGLKKTILLDHHEMLPDWLKLCGSIAVAAMLGWYYLKTRVLNKTNEKEDTGEKKTSLNVQGMTCMHCASNIRKAVESVTGISCVSVDLDAKRVEFKANENDSLEEVKAAIRLAGYNV
ncbi:MAG: cation transporter, partial [Thermodesulfobacteriota bacterium]|nr:cation transporter [Thermodesulfobacteriota bacterium]